MDPTLLQPGEMVGPYKIIRKVGQGGMGEVYEAFEENLKRTIVFQKQISGRPGSKNYSE